MMPAVVGAPLRRTGNSDTSISKSQPGGSREVIAGEGQELSDAALRAQWLRRVQTKPSQYLKLKFLYQYKISQMENGKETAK